jgi:hypothetical protein
MSKLRAILPTYVTEKLIVLCKNAPAVRNAYEIRLALFFALKSNRQFLLACPSDCIVDSALEEHIVKHGGSVKLGDVRDYSVYFGAADEDGEELNRGARFSNM